MAACPNCKKSADMTRANRFRPFCSERCQLIDLGTWVSGDYESDDDPDPAGHEHPDDHSQNHPNDLKKRGHLN
jgi:endogenous inhibitor of DNA gyrase (YacG/DUF329 family)